MKKSRFSESQIVGILKESEGGIPAVKSAEIDLDDDDLDVDNFEDIDLSFISSRDAGYDL